MSLKFMPGPWTATAPDGSYHDVIRIYSASNENFPVAVCPQQDSAIMAVLKRENNETTVAAHNARLIAKAPQLLEELMNIVDAHRDGISGYVDRYIDDYKKLIAEATGESK